MRRILISMIGSFVLAEIVFALLLLPEFEWPGLIVVVITIANGVVGALLATRLPGHPIGWLLLVASVAAATGALAVTYAEAALASDPPALPMSHWVIWLGEIAFLIAATVLSTFLLLLFPNGRTLSRRWTLVASLAVLGAASMAAGRILSPESFVGLSIDNPVALDSEAFALLVLEGGGFYLLTLVIVLSFASLVLRFGRAAPIERQQIKWAVFGLGAAALGLVGPAVWELFNGSAEISAEAENFLVMLALTLVPVVIGLAVLRYRLYDIDRIISRTVSYALVVGSLALIFAGGVVLVPNALPGLRDNPALVAASTLAVAAFFSPLRKRVQSLVDRRFNRSRYDNERVMDGFAGSLRHRVDPDGVVEGWVGVVSYTMQPSAVGVWVR